MAQPTDTEQPQAEPAIVRKVYKAPEGGAGSEEKPLPGIPIADYLAQGGAGEKKAAAGEQRQPEPAPGPKAPPGAAAALVGPTPRYCFKIPPKVRDKLKPDRDPYWVVMRELPSSEYSEISRIATNNADRTLKAVQRSLVAYSMDPSGAATFHIIDKAAFEDIAILAKWSQKIYGLCAQGWSALHLTTDDEDADFLGSMAAGV